MSSIDKVDVPVEDRIREEADAAIAAGAKRVTVVLHQADRGRCGPKIIETDYQFFDEAKLYRDTPTGDYQLIIRADGFVKARLPWNVRKPADPAAAPSFDLPPMPAAPSLAAVAGGQVTTQPVGLVELLIAQMNNTAAMQTAQINAQANLMGQLFASMAGTMKERTAERTPLDELIKLHKLLKLGDVDAAAAEPSRPLIDGDTAAALVGVLSKFADRPPASARPIVRVAPPVTATPAAIPAAPTPPAADIQDLDNDKKLAKSTLERALPVLVSYLELAFGNPDAVDDEIASTLSDLMGDVGFPADDVLEQTDPGTLATLLSKMNQHLDAGRCRLIESAMRAHLEIPTDGTEQLEREPVATADDSEVAL